MRRSYRIVAVVAPVALALLVAPLLRPSLAEAARSSVPPSTPTSTPSPVPSKRTVYPKAIALLREARQKTAEETRPDQREILLCEVGEWLNYVGDSETALQALREARELVRPERNGSTSYGRMQRIATLIADCGDTRTALETARMAETELERKQALYEVGTHLAKCDVRSGAWEALADMNDESHRIFTIREISEAAIRANDFADLSRAIGQMPAIQQPSFAEEMAKRLEKMDRKEEAQDIRNRYPFSAEQKKALESSPYTKLFADLFSGKPVDVAEAERLIPSDPNDSSSDYLRTMIGANSSLNGKKEEAQRCWKELADRITKRERLLSEEPIDFPGDSESAIPVPKEDRQAASIAEDFTRCLLHLGSKTPEGTSFFLNLAIKAANRIDTLPMHTQTLSNIISNCLVVDHVADALIIARQLREPIGRSRELCRIAREQIWIEDKKRALETLREADQMANRVKALRERAELLCSIAIAQKRAGDLSAAKRTVARAEGNFNEIKDWQSDIRSQLALVQALAEVERMEDARKVVAGIKEAMPQIWGLIRMANTFLPDERPLRRIGPSIL